MDAPERKPFNKLAADRYSCILVDSSRVSYKSPIEFEKSLEEYLESWKQAGIRAVWVKINIDQNVLIGGCVRLGLTFHHTKPHYVMMKKWLSDEVESLPEYATQYLGCGGFVVNNRKQVLVVQERFHEKPHWKFPGGLANAGEDIGVAACREVKEETGVEAEFEGVLCVRHQHNYKYGCSDLYFVCLLHALTDTVTACPVEIHAAQWMDVDEYIALPDITDLNRHIAVTYRDSAETSCLIRTDRLLSYRRDNFNYVYSAQCHPSAPTVTCQLVADSAPPGVGQSPTV